MFKWEMVDKVDMAYVRRDEDSQLNKQSVLQTQLPLDAIAYKYTSSWHNINIINNLHANQNQRSKHGFIFSFTFSYFFLINDPPL
jgi:hypothetical protein